MNLKRLPSLYVSGALMLVNTLAFLIVLNAGAFIALGLYQHFSQDNPVSKKYDKNSLKIVYPRMNEAEIQDLLKETWSRPFVYEPFTQFKERVYHGKYVNVGIDGFRYGKDQAAWPPPAGEINIFVLGGSTTFGYGVEDSQTIASYLQEDMRGRLRKKVNVYNFGRGFYFSTQERILFERLLSSGYVPNLAIFIDGLNDFYAHDGDPLFTERLSKYVSGEMPKITFLSKLPVVKLFRALSGNTNDKLLATTGGPGNIRYDDPEVLGGVIKRYLGNKKIIGSVAAAYGVRTAFVWQPVPTYQYDISHHLFAGADFGQHTFSHHGYPLMKKYLNENGQGANFLWAADIQKDSRQPLYVDQVHYTAKFSRRFADFIAEFLVKNFY